jgi:hypothetical protein
MEIETNRIPMLLKHGRPSAWARLVNWVLGEGIIGRCAYCGEAIRTPISDHYRPVDGCRKYFRQMEKSCEQIKIC